MSENSVPGWAFLTNHAQVLVCIARDPGIRLREIGERVGITERAAHRIVVELAGAGYISRERNGRRNRYTINAHFPLPDPIAHEQNVGELLAILTGRPETKPVAREHADDRCDPRREDINPPELFRHSEPLEGDDRGDPQNPCNQAM